MTDLEFSADKIKINGPKVDGGFTVTFETGEQEQINVAKLLAIPQQTSVKVKIEIND